MSQADDTSLTTFEGKGSVQTSLQPVQIFTPGNLTLAAGSGNIGSPLVPFLATRSAAPWCPLRPAAAPTSTAVGGDATIGRFFANGTASLAAPSGSIYSYLPGVAAAGSNVVLVAAGDINCNNAACAIHNASPLQLQVGATGTLSGSAGGTAIFHTPTLAGQGPQTLRLGNFTAPTAITITADAGVEVTTNANVTSGGPISVTAASFTMDVRSIVQAGGTITVATLPGDIVLSELKSTLGSTSNPDIVITAGGSILNNLDGFTNLIGENISLTAGVGIGSSAGSVSVNAGTLAAAALAGDAYLSATRDLHVTSLSATQGAVHLSGAGALTLDSVSSQGSQTIEAANIVTFTTLTSTASTGDIDVTSDTGSIIGGTINAGGGSVLKATASGQSITGAAVTATAGLISMTAGGAINWTGALQAGTTAGLTSTGSTISLNTVSGGGTQTIEAKSDVTFTTLTATGTGDIDVTSDAGSIIAGSIDAAGSSTLLATTAGKSITGAAVTATAGLISMTAGGVIDWTGALQAGSTAALTSTGSTITLNTVSSGGIQTIEAKSDVTFTTLTATGTGNIDVTSDAGSIIAGSIDAAGSSTLLATTVGKSITGTAVTAHVGLISMTAGGVIDWTGALQAGTTAGLTSTGSTISLNTVSSGGTQTIEAKSDVTFTTLTATGTGDIDVTSDAGSIIAGSIDAAGSSTLNATTAGKSITGHSASPRTASLISMTAGGAISWTGALQAATTAGLTSTGGTITVATLTSGGTQTLEAKNDVGFTTLTTTGITGDVGDIDVTADTGSIIAGSIDAHGSSNLLATTAGKSITGAAVTAHLGLIGMTAGGAIDWSGALQAGTTAGLTSTGSTITVSTLSSGGTQTLEAKGDVTFTTLSATGTGDVDVTSDTGAIIGGSIGAAGSATLHAATAGKSITGVAVTATAGLIGMTAGGAIHWTGALQAGTTIGLTSTGGTITLNTLTAGGTQTLEAKNDVAFTTLTTTGITGDAGAVNVTADTGSIIGGSVAAAAQATLTASQNNSGQSLTTGTFAKLTAGGTINWSSIQAGTTVTATSTGGTATFGSVKSGGSQTLEARNDVDFTALTTTGIPGDPGVIAVTADTGSIGGGTIAAADQATLTASQAISGQSLTTGSSAKLTAGGGIGWSNIQAGTTVWASSTGGGETFGTVVSGGTQTLHAANDVAFTQLTTTGIPGDAGDVNLTSDKAAVRGGSITANGNVNMTGNGLFFGTIGSGANVTLNSSGSIKGQNAGAAGALVVTATGSGASLQIANMSATQSTLQSQGLLSFANMNVGSSVNLGADQIVGNITHAGTTPLALNITGWQGGIASMVMLNIDPPSAVNIGALWAVDATLSTDSHVVTIADGFVPGSMTLTTAEKTLFLNDRTSLPTLGSNVQMFTLHDAFTLVQAGAATWTNAYVVQFQPGSFITAYLGPDVLLGTSLVDDLPRAARNGDPDWLMADGQSTVQMPQTGPSDTDGFERPRRRPAVEKVGNGPAVNLGSGLLKRKRAQR